MTNVLSPENVLIKFFARIFLQINAQKPMTSIPEILSSLLQKQIQIISELEDAKSNIDLCEDIETIFRYFLKPCRSSISYGQFKRIVKSLPMNPDLIK